MRGGDDSPRTSLRSFCPSLRLRRIEGRGKERGKVKGTKTKDFFFFSNPLCDAVGERVAQRSVGRVSRRRHVTVL
jgi:hypothetical protein